MRLALSIGILFSSLGFSQNIYLVKNNESMSCLAEYYFGRPVYGDEGALTKLSDLNPEIKNLDNIPVGQVLNVPNIDLSITQKVLNNSRYIQRCGSFLKTIVRVEKEYLVQKEEIDEVQKETVEEAPETKFVQNTIKDKALKHRVQLIQKVYQNLIRAKDISNASISNKVSEENFAVAAEYQYQFKERFWTGLKASLDSQHYELEFGNNGFENFSPYLWGLSWVNDYQYKTWSLGANINYQQEPFIVRLQNDTIAIEKADLALAQFELQKNWLSSEYWSLLSTGQIIYPFYSASALNPKGKLSYMGELGAFRKNVFGPLGLGFSFFYQYKAYDTNLNTQTEKSIGLNLYFRGAGWL